MRVACGVALALALLGCGSKSGLRVPEYPGPDGSSMDGGVRDAGPPRDAPVDAPPSRPDVCVELPPREPPDEVLVSFLGRVQTADVYFLVDVTGSMRDEIEAIREQLRDTLVPGIAAEIPDVRFSVGYFADFPLPELGYGEPGDDVFALLTSSTDDIGRVQDAVNLLELQGGNDTPEAEVEALYLSASGESLPPWVRARSCPEGAIGYPCFRREGSRIVLLFSDAPSHNGPGDSFPYSGFSPPPHTYAEATRALRGIGAKVLGLYSGDGSDEGRTHLAALARDTGAVRSDGTPLVFDIGTDARGLERGVIDAVRTLVDEVPIDVDALVEDEPGDAIDALEFVVGVETVAATPPDGAVQLPDRFVDVRPGTEVSFRVRLANERIERTDEAQRYRLRIVLRGDTVTRLTETVVEVVIPSRDGEGCEP